MSTHENLALVGHESRASRLSSIGLRSLTLLICFGFAVLGNPTIGSAQDTSSTTGQLLKATTQMRKANADLATDKSIQNRIRALSWALVVGEMASVGGGPELYTAAADAFALGMGQLKALEALVKERPELEDEISDTPNLAMRLDTVRVRLQAIQKKAGLSRTEERRRLDAFRQLIRSYRSLTANLAASNAQFLMGDHEQASRQYVECASRLDDLQKVVNQPRMHWLFKDEPRLDTDNSTEAELVLTPAAPFNDDMVAHLKALQSLTAYQMAVPDDSRIKDVELLQRARQWAFESLDASSKPNSAEASRVIPGFVLAQADRCLGLQLTRKAPLSAQAHQQAAKHFQSARKSLGGIAPSVIRPDGHFPGIRDEVSRRIAEIDSPNTFLKTAATLTARGLNEDAFTELGRGLTYHRSLNLLLARAEAGCRNEKLLPQALVELQQAADDGLLPADDPHAQLVRSRCELIRLRHNIVGREQQPLTDANRKSLQETLDRITANLTAMQAKAPPDTPLRARLAAYRALAHSYWSLLAMGQPTAAEKDALRMAKSAAESLEVYLKGLQQQNQEGKRDEITLREALIAARIAQGHLAVRSLPDYHDTSVLAFTAAMDQQDQLPFSGSATRLLGSVLLESLLKRTDAQTSRLALEERQLRIIMTQFTEGSFALYWQQPRDASDQMSRALDRLRGNSKKPSIDLSDASRILAANASIDSSSDVLEAIVAFTAMSHVAAGRAPSGLAVMMNHLAEDGNRATAETVLKQLEEKRVKSAVDRITTPLVGYALGLALESTVVQQPDLGDGDSDLCRRFARAAQQRVKDLFGNSVAVRDRFRYLIALNSEAVQRLTTQQPFLESARRLSQQFRFDEAESAIRTGLLLHPADQRLLANLFRLAIDRVALLDGQEQLKALADTIDDIDQQKAASMPVLAFNVAQILDMYGRNRDAITAYKTSLRDQAAPEGQRIITESRIALLSALLTVE